MLTVQHLAIQTFMVVNFHGHIISGSIRPIQEQLTQVERYIKMTHNCTQFATGNVRSTFLHNFFSVIRVKGREEHMHAPTNTHLKYFLRSTHFQECPDLPGLANPMRQVDPKHSQTGMTSPLPPQTPLFD